MSTGWAHPEWAPALLGAWLALALACTLARLRIRRAARALGIRSGRGRDTVLLGAAALVGLALLGPRLGTRTLEVPGHGIDVVVLLDVSRSMDAGDTPPSRLLRAREAARALLARLGPGDRVALAVFAGRAALLTPLTPDRSAIAEMLAGLDSRMMSDRGSDLGRGVAAALDAFDPASLRPGVILALGDGERGTLVADAEVARLQRSTVRFVAGAIGSEAGSPIDVGGTPLLDAAGRVVETRRDARGFTRLAAASGGSVLLADRWGAFEDAALHDAVRAGLVPGPGGSWQREVPVVRGDVLAALAFLVLAMEATGTGRMRRLGGRFAAASLGALLLGAAPLGTEELEARVRRAPDDANALIALGMARVREGELDEAVRAFAAAAVRARDPAEVALASYDLGVARLEQGDFAGARDAFFDALALAPDDRDAKWNLEWALRALREPEAPSPPRPEAGREEEPRDEARPEPEREETPNPEKTAPDDAPDTPSSLPEAPPPLSDEEIARWLERVEDRPEAAFRAALDDEGGPRSGPQW